MNRVFEVHGRMFKWKVCIYEDGKLVSTSDHRYLFKITAQTDASLFNEMERTRQKEMRLD